MRESAWLANGMVIGLFVIAFVLIVGGAMKVIDLKRKRTEEAIHLQAVISDALLREPGLSGLAVTPTTRAPFWRGSPVTIAVSGTVWTPEHREAILRVVNREAARIRSDFDIDDRLTIAATTRAAS